MPDLEEEQSIGTLRDMLKASGASAVLKAASGDGDGDDKGKGGDDDEEGYDAEYMKKNMKKYLKEKPEDVKAFMKKYLKDGGDEAKAFMKDMGLAKAAVIDAGEATPGIEDAEVTVVDGTAMFKAFVGFAEAMETAIGEISDRLHGLTAMQMETNLLQKASGQVLIKAAEAVDQIGSAPAPVRGTQIAGSAQVPGQAQGEPLQKAAELGMPKIKDMLLKAAMGGNQNAGRVLTQVEAANGNFNRLSATSISFINQLAVTGADK